MENTQLWVLHFERMYLYLYFCGLFNFHPFLRPYTYIYIRKQEYVEPVAVLEERDKVKDGIK